MKMLAISRNAMQPVHPAPSSYAYGSVCAKCCCMRDLWWSGFAANFPERINELLKSANIMTTIWLNKSVV